MKLADILIGTRVWAEPNFELTDAVDDPICDPDDFEAVIAGGDEGELYVIKLRDLPRKLGLFPITERTAAYIHETWPEALRGGYIRASKNPDMPPIFVEWAQQKASEVSA